MKGNHKTEMQLQKVKPSINQLFYLEESVLLIETTFLREKFFFQAMRGGWKPRAIHSQPTNQSVKAGAIKVQSVFLQVRSDAAPAAPGPVGAPRPAAGRGTLHRGGPAQGLRHPSGRTSGRTQHAGAARPEPGVEDRAGGGG